MKQNLFISQYCTIHRETKSLKVDFEDKSVKIPLSIIENLFLIGNSIKLTNGARGLLLENNKSIFYYTSSYKLQGVLSNTKLQSNYRNRLFQYEAYSIKSLDIAKYIVQEKLKSINKELKINLSKSIMKTYEVKNITELLGVEGYASTKMFTKFKKYLQALGIDDFKKREYRPTKDKINGLLSFTYTLYSNLLYGLVLSQGYDPYIGFLHKKRGTHYAFVSDLIEQDRAKLTVFVLQLFGNQLLDYTKDFDGIYLNQNGRQKFLKQFNKFTNDNLEQSKINLDLIGEKIV